MMEVIKTILKGLSVIIPILSLVFIPMFLFGIYGIFCQMFVVLLIASYGIGREL